MKKLNELKQKFKKIDYKDRKYVLPILALPFILFLAYQIYGLVAEEEDDSWMLANHNELNDNLPDASTDDMASRIDALNNSFKGDGYTAMDELKEEKEEQMQDGSAYTENEKNKLDSLEKVKQQRQKAIQDLQKELGYNGYNSPQPRRPSQPTVNGATNAAQQYAEEIRKIQKQIRGEAEEEANYIRRKPETDELNYYERSELNRLRELEKEKEKEKKKEQEVKEEIKIVKKAEDKSEQFFHSVQDKPADDALIKAMIDQTIKVVDGTRIRLKLLNDVTIDSTRLEKGTYLYALVRGFSGQRVMAHVTSILVKDKFIKVNLSLFDNDGMEGFYVPASSFREMVKNAGGSAVNGANMNMNNSGGGASLNGEFIALQAVQQAYTGVTQAISNNIRKNKAKIKYNTVVYLINSNGK